MRQDHVRLQDRLDAATIVARTELALQRQTAQQQSEELTRVQVRAWHRHQGSTFPNPHCKDGVLEL